MKAKKILLASVAGTVVAPAAATAADMPVKAAPKAVAAPVAVAPSWAGLYLGVHAGAAWHKAKADTNGTYYGDQHLSDKKSGFIGGGLIGYNLQSGIFVYGVEADISGLSAKATAFQDSPVSRESIDSDIRWMATARARLGLATGNLLTFVTGGVAFADIRNTWTYQEDCCSVKWSESKVKAGPVFGVGAEYMFSPNWTARVEGLWANFGESTVRIGRSSGGGTVSDKPTTFKNRVTVVRGALNYKF